MSFLNKRRQSNIRWLMLVLLFAGMSLSCAFAESLIRGDSAEISTTPFDTAGKQTPAPRLQNQARQVGQGLIAYLGEDGNIYTIDPASSRRQAITEDANSGETEDAPLTLYQSLTWSPDGLHLAILKYSGGAGEPVTASLLVAETESGDTVEAFYSREHFPFYMSWSPDGQYVTLLSNSRSASALSLHLVDSMGGADRIVHTGQPFYWDWSPDARQIFVHTGGSHAQNQDASLGLLDPNTDSGFNEFDLQPSAFQSPAWSPDGGGVVLAVESSGGKENLVLAGVEGNILRTLAEIDGAVAFAWSPEGDRLAYSVQNPLDSREGIKSLYLISPWSDGDANSLFSGPLLAWFWSPDGQKIAYFMLVNSMGKGGNRVAQTQTQSRMGLFVYDLNQGESQQLALFRPTDGFLGVVPYFDQYQRSSTIWSPDSRSLVIAAQDANDAEGIYVVAADGSRAPEKIADGVIGFWSR